MTDNQSPAADTNSDDAALAATVAQANALGASKPAADGDQPPVQPPAPAQNPEPPAKAAKPKTAKPKAAPETIQFISKDPGLKVLLGEGRDIQFDQGVANVSPAMAEVLQNHHLYLYDHISRADEMVRVNGRSVSFKGDPSFRLQADEAREQNKCLFFFDGPRGAGINLGDSVVEFDSGRALVTHAIAKRLRLHRFFVEGRLVEIPV